MISRGTNFSLSSPHCRFDLDFTVSLQWRLKSSWLSETIPKNQRNLMRLTTNHSSRYCARFLRSCGVLGGQAKAHSSIVAVFSSSLIYRLSSWWMHRPLKYWLCNLLKVLTFSQTLSIHSSSSLLSSRIPLSRPFFAIFSFSQHHLA